MPVAPICRAPSGKSLAGLGLSDAAIAECLDHAVTKGEGERVNRVTGICNQSKRMAQKRAVPDSIAVELRRIIGTVEGEMRMAA